MGFGWTGPGATCRPGAYGQGAEPCVEAEDQTAAGGRRGAAAGGGRAGGAGPEEGEGQAAGSKVRGVVHACMCSLVESGGHGGLPHRRLACCCWACSAAHHHAGGRGGRGSSSRPSTAPASSMFCSSSSEAEEGQQQGRRRKVSTAPKKRMKGDGLVGRMGRAEELAWLAEADSCMTGGGACWSCGGCCAGEEVGRAVLAVGVRGEGAAAGPQGAAGQGPPAHRQGREGRGRRLITPSPEG